MQIREYVSLAPFTTFGVGGPARYFVSAENEKEIEQALEYAKANDLSVFVLGGGSNIVMPDEGFPGLVIKNDITGIEVTNEDEDTSIVSVGAGESWDAFVGKMVKCGLRGIENLSSIPGSVGAAPVQNIGAYGAEVESAIERVRAYDMQENVWREFSRGECEFAYRSSIFKRRGGYIISRVDFRLSKHAPLVLSYKSLQEEIETRNLDSEKLTAETVRELVTDIRARKLPDWHTLGTAGSFFKNPEVPAEKFKELQKQFPGIPGFTLSGGNVKIPLAWVIEHICDMKGACEGGACVYEKHALVIVDKGNATAADIQNLSKKIMKCVKEKTGINIEPEVRIFGS